MLSQSCLPLCDPKDSSLLGSFVHGILQAILECVAIFFSRGSSWPRDWTGVSCLSCIGRQILFTPEPPGKQVKKVCCYKTSVRSDSSFHDSVFLWQGFGWHYSNLKSFELCNFVCFALFFTRSHQSPRTFVCKTLHFQYNLLLQWARGGCEGLPLRNPWDIILEDFKMKKDCLGSFFQVWVDKVLRKEYVQLNICHLTTRYLKPWINVGHWFNFSLLDTILYISLKL